MRRNSVENIFEIEERLDTVCQSCFSGAQAHYEWSKIARQPPQVVTGGFLPTPKINLRFRTSKLFFPEFDQVHIQGSVWTYQLSRRLWQQIPVLGCHNLIFLRQSHVFRRDWNIYQCLYTQVVELARGCHCVISI